jgi:hypothetical protein
LGYTIILKIKHISRINISEKNKIVINSPKVHLGIKRPQEEDEHKNLFI